MNLSAFQKITYWIIIALIFEGMIVKSAIFLNNDPTIVHYVVSFLIGMTLFLICSTKKLLKFTVNWQFILFIVCLAWSVISSYRTSYTPNMIATITFGALFIFFFSVIPILIQNIGKSTIDVLYPAFLVMSFLSLILYTTDIWPTIDPDSGRFWGAYISVANAGIGFSFFTLFSLVMIYKSQENIKKLFYGFAMIIGLYLCYLTKTRSVVLETIAFLSILYIGYRQYNAKREGSWLGLAFIVIGVSAAISIVAFGDLDWSDTATDYRISEGRFQDSRTDNWVFGVERILNAPLFGEGMLTKQTQGGTRSLDLVSGDNYDPTYDPHSLLLSFGVQAGIPFAAGMIILIFGSIIQYLTVFGIKSALRSFEFVVCAVHTLVMIPSGGDLTSFGNFSDRIFWILLGTLVLRSNLETVKKVARP